MLKINEEYYIDADNYNYILMKKHIITEAEALKRKNVVAGAEEFKTIGYYPTITSAIRKILETKKKKIIIDNNKTLDVYIKDLENLQNDFEDMLGKACEEWLKGEGNERS